MSLGATPSQTVGPYFKIGLTRLYTDCLVTADTPGERITIQGKVLDANGAPVPDAVLEIWQADARGNYCDAENDPNNPCFTGFGRVPTDEQGNFRFRTIKPGAVNLSDGTRSAPHINVAIFMRGLLRHLVTRIYFADDRLNSADPILSLVPEERRNTLFAMPTSDDPSVLQWSVVLQGEGETVFFDW